MEHLITEGFRLSPQQKRLWLLQQQGGASAYRARVCVLIEGPIDTGHLAKAWQHLAERHEILRTTFHQLPGMTIPVQVIGDAGSVPFKDLQASPRAFEGEHVGTGALLEEVRRSPVDVDEGPTVHASLVEAGPDRHRLLVTLPGLCADAPTLRNLVQEFGQAYSAVRQGDTVEEEPLQYADLAAWQTELLESDQADEAARFWRTQTAALPPAVTLPFEQPRLGDGEFRPASIALTIDAATAHSIDELARTVSAPTGMIFLAAWQALLSRLTGNPDVVIGVAHDGRGHEALQTALGLLARYLPVHAHIEAAQAFSELVTKADLATKENSQWQEFFLWESLASADRTERPAGDPILFDFDDQRLKSRAGAVSFSIEDDEVCIERFKLKLTCRARSEWSTARLDYDADVYGRDSMTQVAQAYETLLRSIADMPRASVAELGIVSATERRRLLVDFNDTAAPFPQDACVHQLFEGAAEETPTAVALVYEDRQLTFAEANQRANQLAHRLQKLGVGPDVLVGICVERSLEMVIGLLGVLKAGGAYVPLDPVLPSERLAFMLQDSGVRVVLTQESLLTGLPEHGAHVVCLDRDWNDIEQESRVNPAAEVTPENLAYVMYTSGSTGRPKGVNIEHRSLVNYVSAVVTRLDLPARASFATVSTFAADLGNTAVFPSLCRGGALHVISQERVNDPEAFGEYFNRHGIECLKIVPSHLAALLSGAQPERVLPRKRLVLGGEACPWDLVGRVRMLRPECVQFNHYGPTEATVGAIAHPIENDGMTRLSATVPLGRPLANTQIYVLDPHLEPVPVGVAGELYIGGAGLARGYLHRPELTAERFVTDPFGAAGGRLYRTGDRARYLPDGAVEYLGRWDEQVKVRGFRIELGEIEAVLREHAGVREAVVVALAAEAGEKRLVAYVVGAAGAAPTASELRAYLKGRLPEYMVPAVFMPVAAIPLTPNGKVDRRALPAPGTSRPAEARYVGPRTRAEELLAGIWAQVLRLERVGVEDNFFELGGDSILSIQIIARAHRAGLRLTPKQLFEHQTVAGLAAVAGQSGGVVAEQGVVTGAVPLTPIQHWFFGQALPAAAHYNQAFLFAVAPGVDAARVATVVRALVAHHDALRLRFRPTAAGWEQVQAATEPHEVFERVDLGGLGAAAQAAAVEARAAALQASLGLEAGPLLRVAWFDRGAGQPGRLLVVIHHLAVDGVSWRIVLEDLQTGYAQLSRGEAVTLPPKTSAFKQWGEAVAAYGRSAALAAERAYWLAPGRPAPAPLPVDGAGANTVAEARTVRVALTREETRALLQEVPAVYHTQVNDVLITALVQAGTAWTGGDTLLVDLEGHGREEIVEGLDLSRTVGWFTAIFPLWLTLGPGSGPGEALKAIKEQLRQIPGRGVGYGVLRYLSGDPAPFEALPAAQLRFNYLGQFDQTFPDSTFLQGPAPESTGPTQSADDPRPYLLNINAVVLDGELRVDWAYSVQVHRPETIQALADRFIEALRALIAHCQSPEAGGYTPSDFPRAKVSQKELDRFMSKLSRAR